MAAADASSTSGVVRRSSNSAPNSGNSLVGSTWLSGCVCGGLAAMSASAATHPLDLLKIRLQLSGELNNRGQRASVVKTLQLMLKTEGPQGLYRGLTASLLRQATYSPAKFGIFQALMSNRVLVGVSSSSLSSSAALAPPSTLEKLLAALLSGACGGALSSPIDLVLVRIQADGRLAKSAQRAYSGVFGGLTQVAREGGVRALWRGAAPNIQRAMITTATQFTSYDFFKRACSEHLGMREGLGLHLTSSLMAGVVVASLACPMDVMRTRMMNSRKAAAATSALSVSSAAAPSIALSIAPVAPGGGVTVAYARAYTSTFDCLASTLRAEGPRGFYKGFLPYYCRVGPHVTIMFVVYEAAQKMLFAPAAAATR